MAKTKKEQSFLDVLEEKVHEASRELRRLRDDNQKLTDRIEALEAQLEAQEGSEPGWEEERQEIRQRVERLAEQLESLLEE